MSFAPSSGINTVGTEQADAAGPTCRKDGTSQGSGTSACPHKGRAFGVMTLKQASMAVRVGIPVTVVGQFGRTELHWSDEIGAWFRYQGRQCAATDTMRYCGVRFEASPDTPAPNGTSPGRGYAGPW